VSGQKTTRWRLLARGEVIQPGDEHLNDDAATWSAVPRWLGIPYRPEVLQPMRRRVQETASDA